ncbi:oligosaccharide flippase family protein [Niameybacter massiliensis]|uniref:oligosaccharide flippase family protein n=1 Tax=Niameybacter massiliensis TaxID=1658108 RepID=UPI0006B4388A|nr:oligosaccharide flippase family protein [Niameybacter massiliensis]
MRTQNAVKNISMSLISQVIIIILGFVSRKVFIDNLGAEYLGINGLLTNVLSMMVLIESGIGISIVYNLYKPLAENDRGKITALVHLYKKAYGILTIIMLGMSIILYPLLGKFMKTDTVIPEMVIVYAIFVTKNIVSYLNAYKWALINADQKGYLLARNNMIFQIITTIAKIFILKVTHNYLGFLFIELVIFIVQNMVNTYVVHKRYPYIRNKGRHKIDQDTKENINKNVKAMFFHNIGGYLVCSTDNILISTFIGVKIVGFYSNYTMVISQLSALLGPIVGGIGAGVGNLIATEDNRKVYDVFKTTYLISFWIYSFACIFLFNLLEPFINWWIGEGFLLDKITFFIILINFYLSGIRSVIGTFKSKAGLFVQDKYAPAVEGVINLGASLVLIKYFGLVGVFIGTTISTLAVPFWNQARILYRELFDIPVRKFFIKYAVYTLIMLGTGWITTGLCRIFTRGESFISLVVRGMICVIVINVIYMLVFFRTREFQYLMNVAKIQFKALQNKVVKYTQDKVMS